MATLSKQKNGSWKLYFEHPEHGRRTSITLGKLPKRAAESARVRVEQLLACRRSGTPHPPELAEWVGSLDQPMRQKLARVGLIQARPQLGLGEFLRQYLAGRQDVQPDTLDQLERVARVLQQEWGADRPLDSITPGDVDELAGKLFARWAPNTARRVLARGKQFFAHAVRKKLLGANPFDHLKGLTVKPNRERECYIPAEEVQQLLPYLPSAQWRALVVVYRFQGLRYKEALNLRWEHVNWEAETLTVPSEKTRREGKGVRVMPLFPETLEALEELWNLAPKGEPYLFPDLRSRGRDGKPGKNHNLRTQLERFAVAAGLKPWPKAFQNMRRSCATDLARRFPGYVAAEWLGHSEKVAREHYWRVPQEMFKEASRFRRVPRESDTAAEANSNKEPATPPAGTGSDKGQAGEEPGQENGCAIGCAVCTNRGESNRQADLAPEAQVGSVSRDSSRNSLFHKHLATRPGLEPGTREPKSLVLPITPPGKPQIAKAI